MTEPTTPPPADQAAVREKLLTSIDGTRCEPLGYASREALLAAYDASRTAPVDRAALRDRITTAISKWHRDPEQPLYEQGADAVLAVLPATADRRAVLREAAARAEIVALRLRLKHDYPAANGAHEVMTELRRMADETATTEHRPAVSRWRIETLDNLAGEWAPGTGWPVRDSAVERFEVMNVKAPRWKDGTAVTRRLVRETTTYTVEAEHEPAAGARQDGAQR